MDMCSTRFGSTMCRRQIIASSAATAIAVGFLLFGAVATAVAADLDADGLDDDWETRTGYSRTGDRDSDEDQLEDGDEWTFGTNPLDPDTDDDGIKDGIEPYAPYNTNPLNADSDGDGVRDWDEIVAGTNPTVSDAAPAPVPGGGGGDQGGGRADSDGDGFYDDDELNVYGTDPNVYDTDGDGVGDGEEDFNGTDPLDPNG